MVRFLLLLLLLLFVPLISLSNELSVVLSQKTVEMGKSLFVKISYIGSQNPGLADIEGWQEHFFINRGDVETTVLNRGEQKITETLRLYPKKVGNYSLDALSLGGAIAKPVKITIVDAIIKKVNITPQLQPVTLEVWQGQAFNVDITNDLAHPQNIIKSDNDGFYAFNAQRLQNKGSTISWRLTSHTAGEKIINIPAIEQKGRGRWKFYLPDQVIKVRPLPSYLPITVPVGALQITAKLKQINDQEYWQIVVVSKNDLPQELYGLRKQLAKLGGYSIEAVKVINHTLSKQSYEVEIPNWSFANNPSFKLPFFNTQTALLDKVEIKLPPAWKLPNWFLLLISLIVLVLGIIVFKLIVKWLQTLKAKKVLSLAIQQAQSPQALRQIFIDHKVGQAKMKQLNELCFSEKSDIDLESLKNSN